MHHYIQIEKHEESIRMKDPWLPDKRAPIRYEIKLDWMEDFNCVKMIDMAVYSDRMHAARDRDVR